MNTAVILFLSFILFVLLGVPIAVSLGVSTILALITTGMPLLVVAQRMFTSMDVFPLMAIPFFMLAGLLMQTGGISKRLINLADAIIGSLAGGLGLVSIAASMFFAAISGSSPGTVSAIGTFMIPEMEKKGYGKEFSTALIASSGTIGVIIPPSIPMITYSVIAGTSIGTLFLAGIGAGIIYGLALMLLAFFISKKRNYRGSTEAVSFKKVLSSFKESILALLMPIIVLGGIYGGIFTPTEAAAVAVLYAFIIGVFVYKEIKIKDLPKIFLDSAVTAAVVMLIISTSSAFGWLLARERIPIMIAEWFLTISENPKIILLTINILLLIVGTFMETNAAIIILTPVFLPLIAQLGIDPILFGLIVVVNLALGMCTPPLGVNLFVACGISKISIEDITKEIWIFVLVMIFALLFITYVPSVSMFLPKVLMGYSF